MRDGREWYLSLIALTVNSRMFHRWNFVIMPYSPEWRAHRRLFHQYFNQRQSMEYRPLQIRGARAFLQRALDNRMSLVENIKLYVVLFALPRNILMYHGRSVFMHPLSSKLCMTWISTRWITNMFTWLTTHLTPLLLFGSQALSGSSSSHS